MSTSSLTWEQAALRVLAEVGEPMHYRAVAEAIVEQGLTRSVGATPPSQANSALRGLLKSGSVAEAEGIGMYALPEIVQQERQEADQAEEAAAAAVIDDSRLTVKAFGLYWSRTLVDWTPTPNSRQAQLLGDAGAGPVNFADQDGIYLLQSGNETVYAGQSYTPDTDTAGLYRRLKSHHTNSRKSDRWDTFSWFGFRPVSEDRRLLPTPGTATVKDVIDLIEGILIEGLMPRLNMRRGEGSKAWEPNLYEQMEDPQLITRRLSALAQVGQALRP